MHLFTLFPSSTPGGATAFTFFRHSPQVAAGHVNSCIPLHRAALARFIHPYQRALGVLPTPGQGKALGGCGTSGRWSSSAPWRRLYRRTHRNPHQTRVFDAAFPGRDLSRQ